jgi:phosphatidylserine/phosphatidylglycerophosphate/cardiolipin synthase-like enzyme
MAVDPDTSESNSIWCTEAATRAHIVIDAAAYFEGVREAMLNARQRIMLIGWDFDTRIDIGRGDVTKSGPPNRLGDFIIWLADQRPDLDIRLLKWNFGTVKLLGRGRAMIDVMRWAWHKRIKFKLDGAHPPGCSHHQKIVVIDDDFAVCGGIDMTADRWDTRDHLDNDPRRTRPGGEPHPPWHDVTMMVEGDAARALAQLGRDRWEIAGGDPMEPCAPAGDSAWPVSVKAQYNDVRISIARTRAEYKDHSEIREIERLFLDHIARAKCFIYAENQYFASRKVAEAIALRMAEPDPPEIIIVGPEHADGWLEQKAMDGARDRLLRSIADHDPAKRFSLYTPYTPKGAPIYVHAKVLIVDDELVRVGSANMNNRSLGLDSECDVFIDGGKPENDHARGEIAALRLSLLAEHTGVGTEDMAALLEAHGSMRGAIEAAEGNGRHLKRVELVDLSETELALIDNAVLDPESADELFEPFASPGLFERSRILRKPR